jgi:hypothetical protein
MTGDVDRACLAAIAAFPVTGWVDDPDVAHADSDLDDDSIVRGWFENWDHPSEFPGREAWLPYLESLDTVRDARAERLCCSDCFRPEQQCFCRMQY